MEDHSEARAIEDWAEDLFRAYGNTGDWYPAAMLLVAEVRRLRAIKDPGREAVYWKNYSTSLANKLVMIRAGLDEDPSPFDYS